MQAAAKSGEVSKAKIDDSVSRILTQMYKFGLFENMCDTAFALCSHCLVFPLPCVPTALCSHCLRG